MERINVASKSINISDIDLLYGRWIKDGSKYIEQDTDYWHPETKYFTPKKMPSLEKLKWTIARELMKTGAKEVFTGMSNIKYEIIYIPVVNLTNKVFSLYNDSKNKHQYLEHIFSSGSAEVNLLDCGWDWDELSTEKLEEINKTNILLPINKPFSKYIDKIQQEGSQQDLRIFYMPIIKMNCNISGSQLEWICLSDEKCSLLTRTGDFPEDHILKSGCYQYQTKTMIALSIVFGLCIIFLLIMGWIHQNGIGFILYLIFTGIICAIAWFLLVLLGGIIDNYIVNPILQNFEKRRLKKLMDYKKETAQIVGFPMASQFDLRFEKKDNGDTMITFIERAKN